jgi:PAS domain S-box-containing protein
VRLAVFVVVGLVISMLAGSIHRYRRGADESRRIAYQKERAQNDAIRVAADRFRLILDTAHDAFIAIDPDNRIVEWNPQATKMFGWAREEVIGKPLVELIIPLRYREAHLRGIAHYLTTGEGPILKKRVQLAGLRKDGTEVPIELTISPAGLDDKRFFAAFLHDISERLAAEAALAEQQKELERSNAELQQFAYVASHDLQEPLRMVASYTQLLAKRYQGKLGADADEFIHFAVDGAQRMQTLINDLLAYSRVGTRGKPFEPVDISEVLAVAQANLKVAIEESGAEVVVAGAMPTIDADRTQMIQLMQNLIGNAIKFRRPDSKPRVTVSAQPDPATKMWHFTVADNGIGIDPEHHERIFVIFQRLHTREHYQGTGIGLAVCRKIVERHEGKIWVESGEGEGSTFHFTLPEKHEGESKTTAEAA